MRIQWFSMIRVLGLFFVLVYHFYKGFLPGGFIGVDLFFTFSGYLITALLIDEFTRHRRIDLALYMRKRFYRIFPPVCLMLLVTIPLALLIRPDYIGGLWKQVVAVLGFVTNWYEILLGSSYETQFAPHLYLHTWSLAIEVHYYLIWGILLWFLAKRIRHKETYRLTVTTLSGGLFLASSTAMFLGTAGLTDYSPLYFSSLTHAFPLFAGSFLATIVGIRETVPSYQAFQRDFPVLGTLIGLVLSGFALLFFAFFLHFDQAVTYQIGFVAVALWSVSFIFFCRLLHDQLAGQLEPPVLTYIANVSYAVYLFHWPLYQVFHNLLPQWHVVAVLATVGLSFAFATLSFYVIEPHLMGKNVFFKNRNWSPKWTVAGLLTLIAVLSFPIYVALSRYPHLGPFEQDMMAKTLHQSQRSMATTLRLAAPQAASEATSHAESTGDKLVASDYHNVLLVGDSVILDAHDIYPERFQAMEVQVGVGRSFAEGYDIYQQYMATNQYDVAVISLGANSVDNYQAQIDRFIQSLPEGKQLVFITPYSQETPDGVAAIRAYEQSLAQSNERIHLVDWYQIASDNPDLWAGSDGVHFSHTGPTDVKGSTLLIDALLHQLDQLTKTPSSTSSQTSTQDYRSENVLLIGDSVSVHAGERLEQDLPQAILDVQSNRNLMDTLEVLKTYINAGTTLDTVIIATGVNETDQYQTALDQIISVLPSGTRLVLVTPYNGNYVDAPDALVTRTGNYERELANKYDFIQIADWVKTAKSHPEIWAGTDNVHFDHESGYEDYEMLAKASGYYSETLTNALAKAQSEAGKP